MKPREAPLPVDPVKAQEFLRRIQGAELLERLRRGDEDVWTWARCAFLDEVRAHVYGVLYGHRLDIRGRRMTDETRRRADEVFAEAFKALGRGKQKKWTSMLVDQLQGFLHGVCYYEGIRDEVRKRRPKDKNKKPLRTQFVEDAGKIVDGVAHLQRGQRPWADPAAVDEATPVDALHSLMKLLEKGIDRLPPKERSVIYGAQMRRQDPTIGYRTLAIIFRVKVHGFKGKRSHACRMLLTWVEEQTHLLGENLQTAVRELVRQLKGVIPQ